LKITQLCADINIVVEGRKLDDDGNVLLKIQWCQWYGSFTNCFSGSLLIKVWRKGGLEWHQMEPNTLLVKWLMHPVIYRAGNSYLSDSAV
jgi:hypothetical protein